jgi:hypothetical protein
MRLPGPRLQARRRRRAIDDEFQRSPKGDFSIVRTEIDCVDLCSGQVWLVHGTVTRWRVFEMATLPKAAWHPKGMNVAVGGDGVLAVIALRSGEVLYESDEYMAPSYAPNGTLYVRDADFGVLQNRKNKTPGRSVLPGAWSGRRDSNPRRQPWQSDFGSVILDGSRR